MSNPFEPPPNYPPSYGAPGPYAPQGPPLYGQPLPPGTVKNWLMESVLALICCGGVLAIPAIVFAAQVDGHLRQGNYQAAIEASNSAKLWLMIAVGIAVALNLFCVGPFCALYMLGAIAAAGA
ncbi:MAG TPA: CD225/dispanin family protein [Pirellulaceae bacterium]|nr:CD225/dispanin family protein [Pirellulaceae bacterium]